MELKRCMWCKGLFPDIEGPTHRYMESIPGCWQAYGEILAREYGDRAYQDIHRLTVDAYAAQHPGNLSPQCAKSVGIHLTRMYLMIEKRLEPNKANDAIIEIMKIKDEFQWLTPPASLGAVTVADVIKASSVEAHKKAIKEWADSVWNSWSAHHGMIRFWAESVGISRFRQNQSV